MFKITPFLWFDDNAEEATHYYVSIFKNSEILNVSRYAEGAPLPAGTVLTVEFLLEGQKFIALNGGPVFHFNEAVSFSVNVDTQAELDDLWDKLSAGGEEWQCGWLKDKFGLSWQIVPKRLGEMMSSDNNAGKGRIFAAFMKMSKLDIAELEAAFNG